MEPRRVRASDESAPATLLIVDDERAHMTALCNTLTDSGFRTTGFSAPQDALAALRENEFDLLLTDLMMPEMDGIELLRRAQEIRPQLVGVLMTGHATVDSAVDSMKAGALDYILKPFKLSAVLPVLARALSLRRLRVENAALIRNLRERTIELEAVNRDLEAFSSSVSHDLLAPLRAIRGFTQIVQEDFQTQIPEEAMRLLSRVDASGRRMEELIRDLLEFAKLGRWPLDKRTVSVRSIAAEVIEDLRQQQPERRIDVRLSELPDARADPSLLKQVFVNLLANAFKFTRNRDAALVEILSRHEGGKCVYFIRDNGAGFDMQYATGLFGVFRRLHRESDFEGTGVGLSIAHRIVERHGGRIWAEAEVDRGATFHFTLG